MRKYLVLFLLFTGVILVSCSEEKANGQYQENELDLKENESGQNKNEPEQSEEDVQAENADMAWELYHNERFDFCVSYPSNFLKEMGESENHDGNIFATANESSEMRASGIYNVLEETIGEVFKSASKNDNYYGEERIITYKQQKDNWFVVSGNYYESIFYVRTVLVDDTFYTLYFEYHSSEAKKFEEIIKHTTRNFPDC